MAPSTLSRTAVAEAVGSAGWGAVDSGLAEKLFMRIFLEFWHLHKIFDR